MHYITGTEIIIKESTRTAIKPGMSSTQIRNLKSHKTPDEFKDFEPGVNYTLIRIRPDQENVIYTFASPAGERKEVQFSSIKVAEALISKIRGDKLPDYNSAYNRTD